MPEWTCEGMGKKYECGCCGKTDHALVGPFAGGPYRYMCKDCFSVVDDWLDMSVWPLDEPRRQILSKFLKDAKEHRELVERIKQEHDSPIIDKQSSDE